MLWHEHLRRTAKLFLVSAAHYSGLLAKMRKAYMKDRALILMYHRVSPRGQGVPDYSPNGMTVTPAEFEMQMRFLRRHYDVVPLSRIVAAVRSEQTFSPNMCAVTFDDGWHDIYEYAFPILKRYSIPATIYLTTGFVNGAQWFWEERSKYLLALVHQVAQHKKCAKQAVESARVELKKYALDDLLEVHANLLPSYLLQQGREIKKWDVDRRGELMRTLEQLTIRIAPDAPRPFMNWSEVQEMSRHSIDFGNHTITHPVLPDLPANETIIELSGATTQIHDRLGQAPINFAYPYGKFNELVRRQVQREGLSSASTTRLGLVKRDSDPYALNRINMCSDVSGYQPLFAARILGF
jgi:peptidoglycan/xylan/chitin deacetylase (PgdA/CDA1 family)